MRYIIIFLLVSIAVAIGTSVYIYGTHDHHDVDPKGASVFAKDDVVIDAYKSFNRPGEEKVICYRESHRNFYIFILELAGVIVCLTAYGIFTKIRLTQSLRRTQAQILAKSRQLDAQNREMLASIRYAKRIQDSLLPSKAQMQLLSDSFVLYKPKDVVSGDFYWVGKVGDVTLSCAADCTGHGVPGAFLATLAATALNEIVLREGIAAPGTILARLDQTLSEIFGANADDRNDGLEMSIFALNSKVGTVTFAAANASAYCIVPDGQLQLRGDRYTLGTGNCPQFTETILPLALGSSFYQYSDGFPDQFGGPNNKKFSSARLRRILHEISGSSPLQKEHALKHELATWAGNHPQVDDIMVVGFTA